MIWATVSSCSCFSWWYKASSSSAAKKIINLISVLTILCCPCVEPSLVLLEESVCYDSWQNSVRLCPASFCTPRPNLPVTPGISWVPTFAFQSPMMKKVAQMVKCLSTMLETWVRSLGREHPLEKEMAIHSSTIAWKIPWIEEPGRLQSMGWVAKSRTRLSDFTFTFMMKKGHLFWC